MVEFSEHLRSARKAKGLTIIQCAKALGITNPAWNQWETGKREPKFEKLIEICDLLGTTPNDLLGCKDEHNISTVRAGEGSAVVIGSGNASVTTVNLDEKTDSRCRNCQYKKKLERLEKLLSK